MKTRSTASRALPYFENLQRIQDAFASMFHAPIMLVDSSGVPVIRPFRWMSNGLISGMSEQTPITPRAMEKHVQSMVISCREFGNMAISASPYPGYVTMGLPLIINRCFCGAWIVECSWSAFRKSASGHEEMIRWLKEKTHILVACTGISA